MSSTSHVSRPPDSGRRRRKLQVGLIVLAVLAVITVLYTALSSSGHSNSRLTQDSSAAAGISGPVAFTAHTMAGAQVAVPGSRPSVLFFFSVECGSCGPGAQALADVQRHKPQVANFVAVNINSGDTDQSIRGFLTDNHATGLGLVRDSDTRLLQSYQVRQLSTAVILDASGKIVYRAVEPQASQIEAELTKVVSSS